MLPEPAWHPQGLALPQSEGVWAQPGITRSSRYGARCQQPGARARSACPCKRRLPPIPVGLGMPRPSRSRGTEWPEQSLLPLAVTLLPRLSVTGSKYEMPLRGPPPHGKCLRESRASSIPPLCTPDLSPVSRAAAGKPRHGWWGGWPRAQPTVPPPCPGACGGEQPQPRLCPQAGAGTGCWQLLPACPHVCRGVCPLLELQAGSSQLCSSPQQPGAWGRSPRQGGEPAPSAAAGAAAEVSWGAGECSGLGRLSRCGSARTGAAAKGSLLQGS